MNLSIRILLVAGTFNWASSSGLALAADACKTLMVHFVEGWTPGQGQERQIPDKPHNGRDITGVFTCHGGNFFFPSMTVLHFIEEKPDGRICYRDRSCGNVHAWEVNAGISLSLWNLNSHLSDFTSSGDWLHYRGRAKIETHGQIISLDVGIQKGHIDRFCQDISEELCI